MKIKMRVEIWSRTQIVGWQNNRYLEYVYYHTTSSNTDETLRTYYASKTLVRYMTRMVARYNFSGWNIK